MADAQMRAPGLTTSDRGISTFLLFRGYRLNGRSFGPDGRVQFVFDCPLSLEAIASDPEARKLIGALELVAGLIGDAMRRK